MTIRRSVACIWLGVGAALVAPDARAQEASTEARIRQLEEQVRAMMGEIDALKRELQQQRNAQVEPSPPSGPAAAPSAGVDAGVVKRAQADAGAAAAAAAEAKEQAASLEQRMETTGLSGAPDGIGFQDSRGRWSVRFNGRVQADYRTFEPDGLLSDSFNIRRARLGMQATFLRDYLARIEGEYASGNPYTGTQTVSLTHAYLQFGWFNPYALIRVGQSKPQFGLENTMNANFIDFLERGLTQALIQNLNFDRGIMVDDTPLPGFNYGASITNGTGINTSERQANAQEIQADGKMLTVRATQDFAPLLDAPRAVIHLGADYKTGSAANSPTSPYSAPSGTTEALGLTFFTPQPFNAATGVTATKVDRTLLAYELALAYGPLKLQGEYWSAKYQGTREVPAPLVAYDLGIRSYYLDLMWMITGEDYADAYKAGQFGRIRPRNNFDWNSRTWGAWEVGLRFSELDASDFTLGGPAYAGRTSPTQTAPVDQGTNRAQAWTFGLKWIPNAYTRLMVNYIRTQFDTAVIASGITTRDEDAITLRAQFDF